MNSNRKIVTFNEINDRVLKYKTILDQKDVALERLMGFVTQLSAEDEKELDSAVQLTSYGAPDGRRIERTEVNKQLREHFELEPGVAQTYLRNIFAHLTPAEKLELQNMKAVNCRIRDEFDLAMTKGNKKSIAIASKNLSDATMAFFGFLLTKNIPFILEVTSEIGIKNYLHTYSGGLGVLMGDKHKVATDMEIPLITFAILPEHGYGAQKIDTRNFSQVSFPDKWEATRSPALFPLDDEITIPSNPAFGDGKPTKAKVFVNGHVGKSGFINPVFYFSTYHCKENNYEQRQITEQLYPSFSRKLASQYGLAQLVISMVDYFHIKPAIFNLNEGHAAMLPIMMMRKYLEEKGLVFDQENGITEVARKNKDLLVEALNWVKDQLAFVTHTIDRSAFDCYNEVQVRNVLDNRDLNTIFAMVSKYFPERKDFNGWGQLQKNDFSNYGISLPEIAIFFCTVANAVAKIHEGVTEERVFPKQAEKIHNVTNAIHSDSWWGKAKDLVNDFRPWLRDVKTDYASGFKVLLLKNVAAFRNA
ncbi:MAG: hypothetical protein WC838_00900, partial [Candidatus Margulisiibacteriota bacterium]